MSILSVKKKNCVTRMNSWSYTAIQYYSTRTAALEVKRRFKLNYTYYFSSVSIDVRTRASCCDNN